MPPLPKAPPRFTITLSREAGIDAHQIAQPLAQRLGWTVYDHELVEHIAREEHVRAELLDTLDETSARQVRYYVESIYNSRSITSDEYSHDLLETLTSLAAHGDCIIVGRGASMVLPPESTAAVRLVAALVDRVKAVRSEQMEEYEAEAKIKKLDAERHEFVKTHFHKDPAQPEHYDLVLNLSRMKAEHCVELILKVLELQSAGTAAVN